MVAAPVIAANDPAPEPVISLRDIHKVYDSGEVSFHALRGVSLDIPRGQFVAIVGPSGSGKSTLMNLLGCLDRPSEGTYLLAGHDVSGLGADERAFVRNQALGFIFQGFNLLARTSALENVEMPLVYRGVRGADREERSARALGLVGLGDRMRNTSTQLSGGQQQRVAIARALVTEPDVLLADEPTGNLDSKTTEEILAMLQWLNRERGLTIVMVTHEPSVASCASRIVTVRDGLIVSDEMVAQPRAAVPPDGVESWETASNDNTGVTERSSASGSPFEPEPEERLGGVWMMWVMALRLALRSLARAKLRATLTAVGILIGIAAVVTTSALGNGARERMEAQMLTLGANLLVVYPNGTNTAGARSALGTAVSLTDDDAMAIRREIPTVAAVAPTLGANVQVVAAGQNASTRVTGTTPGYFEVRNWTVALGSLWTWSDVRSSARVCVIGETVRSELFGTTNPVGMDMRIGRMPCTIVAVFAAKGQSSFGQDQDDTVVVPVSTFRSSIYRLPNSQVNQILVTASGPNVVHRAEEAITALLHQRHHIAPGADDDFAVRNLSDILSSFEAQRAIITALLLSVASISLLVGGIGVMNIMLVSVTERTREIGIRLAIGARAADILAQFLIEAVVLSAIGGLAGLAFGFGASVVLGRLTQFSVALQPDSAIVALLVSGGIGVIFGFFPARRAAQLDPIVALRHE